jgi:hypothetical protein
MILVQTVCSLLTGVSSSTVQKLKAPKGCFLSYRVMADSKLTPVEDSLHGPKNVGQSDPETMIREDTDSVYVSLDPTYVAKANILNDAIREIGMGKYQVGPAWFEFRFPCAT